MVKHCPNPECAGLVRDGVVPEYRDTLEVCLDCGSPLAFGERPAVTPTVVEFHELVTIFIASDLSQGQVVASAIEAAGIPVFVKGELLQGAVGELPPAVSQVEVQVPIERAESGRKIAMIWEGPAPEDGVSLVGGESDRGRLDELDAAVAEVLDDDDDEAESR